MSLGRPGVSRAFGRFSPAGYGGRMFQCDICSEPVDAFRAVTFCTPGEFVVVHHFEGREIHQVLSSDWCFCEDCASSWREFVADGLGAVACAAWGFDAAATLMPVYRLLVPAAVVRRCDTPQAVLAGIGGATCG